MRKFLTLLLTMALILSMFVMPSNAAVIDKAETGAESWLWPVPSNKNTSQNYSSSHKGIDIPGSTSYDIVSTKSGTVLYAFTGCGNINAASTGKSCSSSTCSCNNMSTMANGAKVCNYGAGNGIVVKNSDGTHAIYAHMSKLSVKQGASVKQGDVLGKMGNYGYAAGVHLHFSISKSGSSWYAYDMNNTPNSSITYTYTASPSDSYAPWDNIYVDQITETNAVLHGHVSPAQAATSVGVQLGTSTSNLKLWCEDVGNFTFVNADYNLNKYNKTLTPGTKYYYRFFFYNGANYLKFSETKSFTIPAKSISGATVTLGASSYVYDGTEKKPSVTVKVGSTTLTSGTDYTVAYSNNKNAGTATVKVTGKGKYKDSVSKNFTITAKDLSAATVTLGETKYIYDGTEKTPSVAVTDGATILVSGTDYTVSYANNVNIGSATVTVTGKGNYKGTVTKIFTIENVPPTEPPTEAPTEPPVDPDAAQIAVSSKTAIIGSTVSVDITVQNNPGVVGMTLDVGYDSDALTLTEVKDGGILGVNTHKPELTSPYTLSWSNDTASENITANGVIATLVFSVKEDAALGDYPITLSYDYDNYDIYDVNINKVKFAVANGKVTVKDVLYGDVNGDGKVNNIDRVHLTRYLAKWADYQEINLANADVNDDGRVNNMDKVILTRHLAKWGAYATLPCQP